MPIDPSIPLSVQQPKAPDMIGDTMRAFTLKSAMMQSKQAEQQMADQAALKAVLSDPNAFDIDPQSGVPIPKPETMKALYAQSPTAAMKLGEGTLKMREAQTKQREQAMKMRKEYVEQAGPTLATLASEYEQAAAKGDKSAAWAAIQPKVEAANAQFEPLAKQAGVEFQPIKDADHLLQGAGQWSKYAEHRMKGMETAGKPQSAEGKILADVKGGLLSEEQGKKALEKKDRITVNVGNPADEKLGPDELNFMARQALRGDTSVFQNIGRGRQSAANIAGLRHEIMKEARAQGIQPEQLAAVNAEFQGLKAGERTLGTRTANIEMAVTEAQKMAPLALTASEKVDRTRFPTLNAALLAAEKGTGGEEVVRLGVATNSLINIYSRAISPTGVPTVSDKDHARELLSAAWSKGQFAAGVDQLLQEMAAARQSPGLVRQSFREAVTGQEGGAAGRPDTPASGPSKPKRPLSAFAGGGG